jgi:uncharacterized FlaG/YvyC family protein
MSDDQDVLLQADKLMRRHRVFVAGAPAPAADAGATGSIDDLPVLTDMVDFSEAAAAPAPVSDADPEIVIEARAQVLAHELLLERLSAQREAIATEILVWLDRELPQIILQVVDGLTDQIVAEVTVEARTQLLPRLQLAVETESQPSRDAAD